MSPKPTGQVVLFDFDSTLTRADTLVPFFSFLFRNRSGRERLLLLLKCLLTLSRLKVLSNHGLKVLIARWLLKGLKEDSFVEAAEAYFEQRLEENLCPEMTSKLVEACSGHSGVLIVSSNFSLFLRPLRRRWPITGIIATDLEVVDGRFSGRLIGKTCHGSEKVARVVAELGPEALAGAISYGNRSDLPLLETVHEGYLVTGNQSGAVRVR